LRHGRQGSKKCRSFFPGMTPFFFIFITITGLGILNLVVGMMVQGGFSVIGMEKANKKRKALVQVKQVLTKAKDKIFANLREEALLRKRQAQEYVGRHREGLVDGEVLHLEDKSKHDQNGDHVLDEEENDDVGRDQLSIKELQLMLGDAKLLRQLSQAGIRLEQVLMVFQKLDVIGAGSIGVEVFIEGLLRMKQEVQGVVIAASKSWMRRLVYEVGLLDTETSEGHTNLTNVVERLRGIKIRDRATDEVETDKDDEDADAVDYGDRIRRIKGENRILRQKIKMMRGHVETREQVMKAKDLGILCENQDPVKIN